MCCEGVVALLCNVGVRWKHDESGHMSMMRHSNVSVCLGMPVFKDVEHLAVDSSRRSQNCVVDPPPFSSEVKMMKPSGGTFTMSERPTLSRA
jgi:hypothetical protein